MLIGPRPRTPTSRGAPSHRNAPGSGGSDQGSGQPGRSRGTGASDGIKVKGNRATSKQRHTIDGLLSEADQLGASRRVMVALLMTATQESNMGEDVSKITGTGAAAYTGILQQTRSWVDRWPEDTRKPATAARGFLVSGPTAWKKVNGGLKKASGNLAGDIQRVQAAGAGASPYAQWEAEATKTVEAWRAGGAGGEFTRRKRYEFSRGERHGQRENSWDCMARLVGEVGAYRWAAGNTLYAVSGDELRAGAPSLTIHGDEGWLIKEPTYGWANNRPVTEIVLDVLSEHWTTMPGATVVVADDVGGKVLAGRYYVWHVSGESLDAPVVTVSLRRPTRLKDEPAAETVTEQSGGGGGKLKDICSQISRNRSDYLYGGGHGPPLKKLSSSDRMDCSSSCSLALYRAGMFSGEVAIVSGAFASSYGKPGKGDEFTVWANATHVWIEGYDSSGDFAWRFDTSQHGGKSGPMLTTAKRDDQSRFTARHWPRH